MAEGFWALVRADARRYRDYAEARFGYRPLTFFLDPGFVCVFLHRSAHALNRSGLRKGAWGVMQLNSLLTGADIVPASRFGPGLLIPQPCGVTLSTCAGRNLTVAARAGVGGSVQSKDVGSGPGLPLLGENVMLGEYSGVQGGILIGDNAVIEGGAGALVDVPAGGRGILASEALVSSPQAQDAKTTSQPQRKTGDSAPCSHAEWTTSWRDWKADIDRLCNELQRYEGEGNSLARRLFAALNLPLLALLVHRCSHWLYCNGYEWLARFAGGANLLAFRLAISPRACVGGGVLMPHIGALSFSGRAGPNLTIYANCVVLPGAGEVNGPTLGAAVLLGGHAGVIGDFTIGDGVHLAPKVQLTNDAPARAQAFSPMSRVKRLMPGEYVGRSNRAGNDPPGSKVTIRECRTRDRLRLRELAPEASFTANLSVSLFRRAAACHHSGRRRLCRWIWRTNMYLTGSDLAPDAIVGPGLVIPYPAGVSVYATAGADLTMHAQSMLVAEVDAPWPRQLSCAPMIGDGVTLEAHSGICGPADVGSRVQLRAGCILRDDVTDDAIVEPRPIRLRMPIEAAPAKR